MERKGMLSILKNKRGFTLMELIIVITVLAILVTMALLYYGNLTAGAHRVALLSDLEAVDKAVSMYQSSYNGLPVIGTTATDISTIGTVTGSNNIPATIKSGLNVYVIDATNANFMSYIKKTSYLLKGNDTGEAMGSGVLYYVDSATAVRSNTADVSNTPAINQIQLDAAASAVNDFYNDCVVNITGGTGAGQSRTITDYVGATQLATVNSDWTTAPDATSTFTILHPVKMGDLLFVQSTTTTANKIKASDTDSYTIYKY